MIIATGGTKVNICADGNKEKNVFQFSGKVVITQQIVVLHF